MNDAEREIILKAVFEERYYENKTQKICLSCEHLDKQGFCHKFSSYPPNDFLLDASRCDEFIAFEDIPF